jgi:hypothetical protein
LFSEPSLGSFVQPRLVLWCAGRGKSLCWFKRSTGTWLDSSPHEPGRQRRERETETETEGDRMTHREREYMFSVRAQYI